VVSTVKKEEEKEKIDLKGSGSDNFKKIKEDYEIKEKLLLLSDEEKKYKNQLKELSKIAKGKTDPDNLCPLTEELMFDPVTSEDGHTYERLALETWFSISENSPLTNMKLSTKVMFPNQAMKKLTKMILDTNKSQLSK